MSLLEIKDLTYSYSESNPIFKGFNLNIEEGKIVAIAGESGCGKSTLLNLIYGYLEWEKGDIFFENRPIFGPKVNLVPGEENMKLVAQSYTLMPYGSVYDNVGKFISNIDLEFKRSKVNELLDIVGMKAYADKQPKFLSGGQQQRVEIAKALSSFPKLLLLDEPFSHLDYSRKIDLRGKLFDYAKKNHISVMISTHDVQEVLPWLDEIIIIKSGEIIQKGIPEFVYQNPNNEYVAKLFGEVNIFTEKQMKELGLSKNIYFPKEIVLTESGIKANVLESRFSGSFFWNKLKINEIEFVIYTDFSLKGEVFIRF